MLNIGGWTMKNLFSLKNITRKKTDEDADAGEEYVELDTETDYEKSSKVVVRPFIMDDFSDIKEILDTLREGRTIVLINIKPLKDKDLVELKRAINKLKKTCDAIEGDIAGFGDDYIVVTPSFAEIHRSTQTNTVEE
jgi:SepF-like predicted cell division protein (DUF552 family)